MFFTNITKISFAFNFLFRLHLIPSTDLFVNYKMFFGFFLGKPNPPDNVTCIGRPNSVLIYWKSNFNGGDTQSFKIFIQKDGGASFYDSGHNFEDPGRNIYLTATIQQLTPDTTYHLKVHAVNEHNFTVSELTTCNTTSAGILLPLVMSINPIIQDISIVVFSFHKRIKPNKHTAL